MSEGKLDTHVDGIIWGGGGNYQLKPRRRLIQRNSNRILMGFAYKMAFAFAKEMM